MRYLRLVFTLILIGCKPSPPPSDQSMIEIFRSNRSVFEALQKMACDDGYKVVSMDPEWSKPEDISVADKEKYYSLFKKIGVSQLQSYDGCRATYLVWSVGLGGGGDYKKYEYRPKNPENIVGILEKLPLNDKDIVFYHRKIDEDWYLSYDHWP